MAHSDYLSLLASLSPAAYWPHDETSGTTLADDSGNSRHETTAGSPSLNQTSTIPGYTGPVVVMDGTNDTISVADAAVFDAVDVQGITYHRWLKMDSAGSGDVFYIIADKTGTSQANDQWGIWWDNRTSQGSPKRLRMTWGNNPTGVSFDWTGDAARDALLAGGMFTFVFHPSSIAYIYLNDELMASGPLYNYPLSAGNIANSRTVQIGHLNGSSFFFKGEMGAGALWASQVTQSNIESLYLAETAGGGTSTRSAVVEIVSNTDYDSFPGHIMAPNGDLLIAYRKGTSHTAAGSTQGIYQTRSTDGGATWGTPAKIISNDASTQFMTAGMSVIGSSCFLVTWTRPLAGGASTAATAVKVYESTDDGATWTLVSTLNLSGAYSHGAYTESRLILHSGYYYLCAYGQTSATTNDFDAGVWRTTDLSTWSRVATWDAGVNTYTEADITVIDGTLVAAIRHNSQESCYTSTSTDGTTWSTPALARKYAVSAPRLCDVGPRERAYMVQRYHLAGRGYLASLDKFGVVREVSNTSGVIMYGQAVPLDGEDVSVGWSAEASSSDADINHATFSFSGYTLNGAAAGAFTWAGSAVGSTDRSGAAAGAFTWAGTASGGSVPRGSAAGAFSWAGSSTGTTDRSGSAAGAFSWAGVAAGSDGESDVIEVTIDCGVQVGPLSVEIGGAAGTEDVVTVNIDCGVDLTPYLLLRPTPPPLGVITEWPIERHAHLMAALSEANPTYSGGIDYDIERETIGRHHVFVGGVDVTYKDGCPAFFEDWSASVPFGPESARIAMPQMKPWHQPGVDSWAMFAADAPVEIALVRPDDTVEPLWEGFLAVEGDTSGQSGEDYVFTADGLFAQAAHELHDWPIVMPATDYGHLIADVLNTVTHRRWTKIPRFTTGHTTSYRGEQGQTKWQYVQDLLARCFHDDGRQLTLARVAPYTYRIQWKKAQGAAADFTVTKGAPGVSVSLERNHAARVDAIYGRGFAPDGGFWCGRVFPGLDAGVPPLYPMAGFASISVGTTDADTTTGNGVSTWQRQMRELGYPVPVDGVMNGSDTRWVEKIQRESGSSPDGILGPQTWAATWENNSTAGDFTSYRLPLATRAAVEPHLYGANGAIIGANPADDTSIVRHAIEVDFKTNIEKSTAIALSQAMLDRLSDVGYQGTITLLTDPHEAGTTRFDIREGDNVHVVGHHGGVTVQVSEVSRSGLEVRLTVDSLARDAEIVANLLDRAEEARRDLAGRTGGADASRLNNARTVPYESESRAGRVKRTAINGNSGLWTIRKAFVSQVGVAKVEFETSPKAQSVTALFNRPVTANRIASLVPDPLTDSDGWYDAIEALRAYGLMEVFGTPDNSGGFWPRQEGEGPLTGKMRDSASTLYDSPYGGFVWVAMFTSRSCWMTGTVFPAVPS